MAKAGSVSGCFTAPQPEGRGQPGRSPVVFRSTPILSPGTLSPQGMGLTTAPGRAWNLAVPHTFLPSLPQHSSSGLPGPLSAQPSVDVGSAPGLGAVPSGGLGKGLTFSVLVPHLKMGAILASPRSV